MTTLAALVIEIGGEIGGGGGGGGGNPPPGATGALLSYLAFGISVATPIGAAIAAWRRSRTKREQLATAIKTEAEAGSVTSGITLEGWRESRQEVRDARTDAREARERADRFSERLDECEAENRQLRAQVAALTNEVAELTDELQALRAGRRRPSNDPMEDP